MNLQGFEIDTAGVVEDLWLFMLLLSLYKVVISLLQLLLLYEFKDLGGRN